jgi:hypothetical protein
VLVARLPAGGALTTETTSSVIADQVRHTWGLLERQKSQQTNPTLPNYSY